MRRSSAVVALIVLLNTGIASPLAARPGADQPDPKLQLYFWERVRQESWDNTMSLDDRANDSSAYLRLRTGLGAYWRPGKGWELHLRLSNENRLYLAPKLDPRLKKDFDVHELFVDQLSVRWRSAGPRPLTVTLGRQDMMFGEGFLIMDGGPLDGSRSAYFNGLRLDWAPRQNANLTFFLVRQGRSDRLLPVVNDQHQAMAEQEEQGVGLYYRGKAKRTALEAYLFRKDAFAFAALPRGSVNVAGGRVVHPFSDALSLSAEAALQLGKLGQETRRGLGGYVHLDGSPGRRFPVPALVTLGGIWLSGDDPGTPRCEAWDPAFGRWPKWSDSLIYLQARETRIADWTNFASLFAVLLFAPSDRIKLSLGGHFLSAPERTAPAALLSGAGRDRGGLFIAKASYEASKNLTGRLIWEWFNPGSFYRAGADPYHWVQFEMFFRF
ncbi:MAG TPA: hypothetical protein PK919_08405 [Candidatus Aminicenantes bacterium]|nr:hypothetical protein [Candidatus Aminicenantes bacterium]